jgi:DNA-binding transcriptional MerR regulator
VLLTIGQLAEHCGVTVRAIRHYHRIGLLPEPARDASGYRRYGAQSVVALVRIKVLAEAGVPLAEVRALLDADPESFASSVDGIDQTLRRQVAQIEHRRRQLAGLVAGDRLVLPAEVADMLDVLRGMGVSDRGVDIERDGWVLLEALCPEMVGEWTRQKRAALADEEFRRLYLACDEARDWDASDPRLNELAGWMVDWAVSRREALLGVDTDAVPADPSLTLVEQLIAAELSRASPAWRRLGELSKSELTPPARAALDQEGSAIHRERGGIAAGTRPGPV